jgi:hypothetical protein
MAAKRVNVSAAITGTVLLTAALFGTLPGSTSGIGSEDSLQPIEVVDVAPIVSDSD